MQRTDNKILRMPGLSLTQLPVEKTRPQNQRVFLWVWHRQGLTQIA